MKLERHHSLVLADKVLREICKLAATFPSSSGERIYLRTYSNCREQGWHLNCKEAGVSICEHRNSDDICIWYGPELSFEDSGIPNERQHREDVVGYRCFEPTPYGIKEAASFCFYFLVLPGGSK